VDYTSRLEALKDSLDKAKLNKVKYEERLNILLNDRENILKEIKALGIEPENLEAEIKNLENKIATDITKAEELLKDNE
jgi:predicted  nucleic acid-binding Zn-ribbon protein